LIKDTEDTLTIEQSDISKIIISDLMIGWWKSASGQLIKLLSISPGQDQIDALVTEILSEIEEEY
jgi:hypothetical protein